MDTSLLLWGGSGGHIIAIWWGGLVDIVLLLG